MKPQDLLILIGIALVLLLVVVILLIIFRKRRKLARIISSVLGVSYLIFFAIYPTILSYIHAQRYDQLVEYLQKTYPNEEFDIQSRNYDDVIQLGDFSVNKKSTPNTGHTYRVMKGGEIIRLDGSWQSYEENE